MKNLIISTLAALVLATPFAGLPAHAETLVDPTRPPAALVSRSGAGDGLPRLQSVLISPRAGGRRVAVIDGETVRLGDSYRGARVARMTQSEVVLVKGQERQVLRLEPAAAEAAGTGISPRN